MFRNYPHICLLTCLLFLCSTNPFGQFQLNGSASSLSCKCYQLTPDVTNMAGSVWNIYQIDLSQPFDYSFTVNLGCNTGLWTGADGMVFALQPISTSIGSAGGQMGLGGVIPSLGVFIDTWQNTSHNDPYNDHISINLNGDVVHTSPNNIAGPYDLGEVENCTAEPLRIVWNPNNTLMTVYYNNLQVLTYTGDIVNTVFGGNPMVYWGFTASTGGASNFHQFCLDVTDVTVDTTNMITENETCDLSNGSISGININGGISPYQWTWNGNTSLNLDTFNLDGGNYQLNVTDGMGCTTDAMITIGDISAPEIDTNNLILKNEDCGQENGFIQNIVVQSLADTLSYFWNGIASDSLNLNNLSGGNYQLIVLDNNGCRDTLDLSLVDTNYHQIDIGYNTLVLEAGEPIDFYEISNDTSVIWNWDFGDDSTSNLSEPTHMYNYAGTYTICLVASNQYGCSDTACVELELEPAEIVIPTIFTPNGDLTNDLFEIKGINDRFGLRIYNRWGNILYDQKPYENNWDGLNMKGNNVINGTYYYILTNELEEIERNGSFVLQR